MGARPIQSSASRSTDRQHVRFSAAPAERSCAISGAFQSKRLRASAAPLDFLDAPARLLHLSGRMEVRNALVEVVLVGKKPRVRPVGDERYVWFPRSLRIPGARYCVEVLRSRHDGEKSWTAAGKISRVA